jgi:DMSO/TMAO reductase YedYZ molybdopterin-dependent catalytic subunit
VVLTASLVLHVVLKAPVILRAYRDRGWLRPLRDDLRHTVPERSDGPGGLVPVDPAPPTISRRGLFAFVGGASALLVAANVGQTVGGPLRPLAFLAPRRDDFPVNRTAARAQITRQMVGPGYRLTLTGGGPQVLLDRDRLLALPQHTARLPIACVEGWTTTQEWTGVRLAELARAAGLDAADVSDALVRSLQPRGVLSKASLNGDQVRDADSMLALKVNGADLPLDHGYPARIIVPALPGVHNTKWVASIDFRTA